MVNLNTLACPCLRDFYIQLQPYHIHTHDFSATYVNWLRFNTLRITSNSRFGLPFKTYSRLVRSSKWSPPHSGLRRPSAQVLTSTTNDYPNTVLIIVQQRCMPPNHQRMRSHHGQGIQNDQVCYQQHILTRTHSNNCSSASLIHLSWCKPSTGYASSPFDSRPKLSSGLAWWRQFMFGSSARRKTASLTSFSLSATPKTNQATLD